VELRGRSLGPFQTNCYILTHDDTKTALVIDPGEEDPWLDETLAGYTVTHILLTHGHCDHIGGVDALRCRTGAPVYIHEAEEDWLTDPKLNGSVIVMGRPIVSDPPDRLLKDGDEIQFAGHSIQVMHTPGHTPGGVSFLLPGLCFCGDTVFYRSIGRTDLPGGDFQTLIASIKDRILTLPGDTRLFPGHGPVTTVKDEARLNPFLGPNYPFFQL